MLNLPYEPETDTESKIINALIPLEYGVHYWEHDRGGPTAHGITQKRAQEYGYTIPEITPDIARAIMADYYYYQPRFDELPDIRLQYRMCLDGLHSGREGRIVRLQETLNIGNLRGTRWPDIDVDGKIGPKTLTALRLRGVHFRHMGDNEYYLRLCARLTMLQGARYHQIVLADETQEDYEHGWYNRLVNQPDFYEFGGLSVH